MGKEQAMAVIGLGANLGEREENIRRALEAVAALPGKYREAVYLHYYEGYSAPEIGRLLGKNPNTAYTLLTRARKLLKDRLGGDGYGG